MCSYPRRLLQYILIFDVHNMTVSSWVLVVPLVQNNILEMLVCVIYVYQTAIKMDLRCLRSVENVSVGLFIAAAGPLCDDGPPKEISFIRRIYIYRGHIPPHLRSIILNLQKTRLPEYTEQYNNQRLYDIILLFIIYIVLTYPSVHMLRTLTT